MYILGIHPDGDYFKVALLSHCGKKVKIQFLQEFKKDILDISFLKKKLDKEIAYKLGQLDVVSVLGGEDLLARTFDLPIQKRSLLKKALPFQLENHLPFASEESSVAIPFIKKGKNSSSVTVYSFSKERLKEHILDIQALGFDPDFVFPLTAALQRFYNTFVKQKERALLIYFGWESSYLLAIKEGSLLESALIPIGLKELVDAVKCDNPEKEEINMDSLLELIQSKRREDGDLSQSLERMQKEIHRVVTFFKRKIEFEGVVYAGYNLVIKEIVAFVDEMPEREFDLLPHLEFDKSLIASFAVEIGLSLEALERGDNSPELRSGCLLAPRQKRKMRKKVATLSSVVLLSWVLSFSAVFWFFSEKTKDVKDTFYQRIALVGDSQSDYKSLESRTFGPSEYRKEADLFLKKHQGERKLWGFSEYPVLATECLSLITSLIEPSIRLEEFHYALDQDEKKNLQTKMNLRFGSSSSESADLFYHKVLKELHNVVKEHAFYKEANGYQMVITLKGQ